MWALPDKCLEWWLEIKCRTFKQNLQVSWHSLGFIVDWSLLPKKQSNYSHHSNIKWSEVAHSCPTLCNPMDSSLHQAPPSMGFSRQEYWSVLPFPSPGNLPDPGIKPRSVSCQQFNSWLTKFLSIEQLMPVSWSKQSSWYHWAMPLDCLSCNVLGWPKSS